MIFYYFVNFVQAFVLLELCTTVRKFTISSALGENFSTVTYRNSETECSSIVKFD